jgi:Carboxypeptidase regulatory-like domain
MKNCLLLAVVMLLGSGPALGMCSVPQPRLICAEYFASEVVSEATLVKIRTIRDRQDPEGVLAYTYTLHADRVIRGRITTGFRVYEGNDSGRATFDWKIGRKYLLFLFYSGPDKSWELDGCGNSGPLSSATVALEEIQKIQRRHGVGFIHGVVSARAPSAPISGVSVEARGASGRYTATTNAKGEFEIKVPPGRYAVSVAKTGFSFNAGDFSYDNPQNVRIQPGGCTQVQFAAIEVR